MSEKANKKLKSSLKQRNSNDTTSTSDSHSSQRIHLNYDIKDITETPNSSFDDLLQNKSEDSINKNGSELSLEERVQPVASKGLESIVPQPTTSGVKKIPAYGKKDRPKIGRVTKNVEIPSSQEINLERLDKLPGRKSNKPAVIRSIESLTDDDDEELDLIDWQLSVLQPVKSPYNKQERIRQANLDLFNEEIMETEKTVKFNDKVCFLDSPDSVSIPECSDDDFDSDHLPEGVAKNKFNLIKVTSDDEDSTSVDSSDDYDEDDNCEEDENVERSSDSLEGNSTYNRSSGNVDLNISDDSNTQVLLVKVPGTNVVVDPDDVQSDNSSSENEDVCYGYSERKEVCTNQEVSNKTDCIKESIESKTNIKIDGEQKKSEELDKKCSRDVELLDVSEAKKNSLCTEDRENFPLIAEQNVSEISVDSNPENISVSPINNTGIKIKITCPDCCEKYNKSTSDIISNDLVNLERSIDSDHDCENSQQSKINMQCKRKEYNLCTLQPDIISSKMLNKRKSNETVKTVCTNISISLHTPNGTKGSCNNNHKPINCTNKQQKVSRNDTRFKKNVINGCTQSEQFVLKKKTASLVKQSIVITSLHTKSIGSKVNEKQAEVLICNTFKSKTLKNELNNHCSITSGRPSSCNFEQRDKLLLKRPETAPVILKRDCCTLAQIRLPKYNGFRSEYGLTEEQLQERRRLKNERIKIRRQRKEEKLAEDERKRKENEETFSAWLAKKNELAKKKKSQIQMYPGFNIRRYSAPANHLLKSHIYQWKPASTKLGKHFCVDKLLNDATPQEKRTYRIYLGLGAE